MECRAKIGPRYNGIRLYYQVEPVRVSETSNINFNALRTDIQSRIARHI